jgi:HAD superfamily hydrolase (TIGR01459 family)
LKKLEHLSEIYNFYDTYIIDLWGVMHNGIKLNERATEAVDNLTKANKKVVFLSNAPRPNKNVINFLRKLNMSEIYLNNILTSGEAALKSIQNKIFGEYFFHLGPLRDNSLYEGLEKNKVSIEKSNFILCTGLFDNHEKDLQYYKKLLKNYTSKKLICTNPDLIVHRGDKEEYCAGAVAKIFEELGGEVVYFGKPYKAIYDIFLKEKEKAFIIGDNLNTDIKGANNLNLDSLFITDGVHKSEFSKEEDLPKLLNKYNIKSKYFQKELTW